MAASNRYNTPVKRRNELLRMLRMLRYTQDNVCYTYSRDAVRRLIPDGVPSRDLDGLTDAAGAVTGSSEDDDGLLGGVFLTETGVYRKTEDGVLKPSMDAFGRGFDD